MKPHAAHRSPKESQRPSKRPVRILTAVPLCDGHDSAIITLNLEFARHGIETIYLGYNRSARDIVRAAIQEDVRGIGISSYNGGHVEFFAEVLRQLQRLGASGVGVFGGGGGTITAADANHMKRAGVRRIFFPGTPLETMVDWVRQTFGATDVAKQHHRIKNGAQSSDSDLARRLTAVQLGGQFTAQTRDKTVPPCPVVGITGPGGAGKSTLIDELALRFLARRTGRLAILSHDPSGAGQGALLGDRATMVYAQDNRVFMRSLATSGKAGGLARGTRACLDVLRHGGFELVLVETAGIGQEDSPFGRGLVDKEILVMSPEYGSRIQLQKILMLERADIVVVNKLDRAGARTAVNEIQQRLASNHRGQQLVSTTASRHNDSGVDLLFETIVQNSPALNECAKASD